MNANVEPVNHCDNFVVFAQGLNTFIDGEGGNQNKCDRKQEVHPAEQAIFDFKDTVKDLVYDQQGKSAEYHLRRPLGDVIGRRIADDCITHDESKDLDGDIGSKP